MQSPLGKMSGTKNLNLGAEICTISSAFLISNTVQCSVRVSDFNILFCFECIQLISNKLMFVRCASKGAENFCKLMGFQLHYGQLIC